MKQDKQTELPQLNTNDIGLFSIFATKKGNIFVTDSGLEFSSAPNNITINNVLFTLDEAEPINDDTEVWHYFQK